jgi:hypothetical protein
VDRLPDLAPLLEAAAGEAEEDAQLPDDGGHGSALPAGDRAEGRSDRGRDVHLVLGRLLRVTFPCRRVEEWREIREPIHARERGCVPRREDGELRAAATLGADAAQEAGGLPWRLAPEDLGRDARFRRAVPPLLYVEAAGV